ncbi:MAG: carbohydrate ABC transporter permease [Eubacteriales bacterium]
MKKPKYLGQKIGMQAFCIFLAILSILPFWLMVVNATRSATAVQSSVSFIPSTFLASNWASLQEKDFDAFRGTLNSATISICSTVLSVYFSTLTAYGISVYNFKGKKALFTLILGIIMIPGQLSMIGFYRFMLQLGLTNSYIPLILPAIAAPSTVFFMKQYFSGSLPLEIVEASRIDGAGEFFTFNVIALPIVKPAMATMAIFAMVSSWNNYIMPLILLSDTKKYTLPLMVQMLKGDIYKTEYGAQYLGITLSILPLMVAYFALSKYIIQGVAMGSVKG